MKIKISYTVAETKAALDTLAAVRKILPSVRVHMSEAHEPFRHIYVSDSTKKGCNQGNDMV